MQLLCGVAVALGGVALLMSDWDYLYATFTFSPQRSAVGWRVGARLLVWGLIMTACGIGLCFEFKSDPAPRKDPWER